MRTSYGVLILLVTFALAPAARAQDAKSNLELYGGYDYLHVPVYSVSGGTASHDSYNLNGGSGQLAYNFNNWFGVAGDLAGYALAPGFIHDAAMTYLAGPRFSLRRHRATPFVQTLFGGVLSNDGITNAGLTSVFAMTAGGGVDFRVSRHVALRPAQLEYLLMKFPDGANNRQNSFRYSSGVVFRLGR
ncbi:MAG TPA: outer membrane beta-barrel protein [Candidatus Acidoferrales bacterium]|nr:outer membrane beta-barrel protein [Candidatus Acidoferrales bacterium]